MLRHAGFSTTRHLTRNKRHARTFPRNFTRSAASQSTPRFAISNAYPPNHLQHRTAASLSPSAPPNLYPPSRETENCGVGLIASLNSIPSRKVVVDADEMLVRMSHRGGCGCDPNSGDGAGMLVGMPHSFMSSIAQTHFDTTLPLAGDYAVGNVFFPKDDSIIAKCKKKLEALTKLHGLSVIGWRPVPVDNTMLGKVRPYNTVTLLRCLVTL